MIQLRTYGQASVNIGASEYHTQVPQAEAVAYVTQRVEKGTVLFALFGHRWPEKRDPAAWDSSRNWFLPDTPLQPVYDSKGNAWVRDFFTSTEGTLALRLWRCVVTEPLDPDDNDYVAANFLGFQNGPTRSTPGYDIHTYSVPLRPITRSAVSGFILFGFSCLGPSVISDLALSGFGFDSVLSRYPGETIDTTPLGGAPYAPRLQIAIYGAAPCEFTAPNLYPSPFEATAAGEVPETPYTIPEGWTYIGDLGSSEVEGHPYYPGLLDTPEWIAYAMVTIAGSITQSWSFKIYYRFVPPGTVEDTIQLGASTWGGSNYLYSYVSLATYRVTEVPCPTAGVDLLQLQTQMLLRSRTRDDAVSVDRSGDAGVSWPLTVTVASDAGPSTVPTLVRNALDQVWCWYHNAAGNTRVYLSQDLGASWDLFATHAGLHCPRAARQLHRLLVVAHDGTALRLYRSTDDGLTLEEIPALALVCPQQVAALAVDRHDYAHLVYRTTGGALQLRRLELDDTWSDPATVAEDGLQPALALGLQYGLVLYWVGETLHMARTDAAYAAIAGTVAAPTGFTRCYLGALTNLAERHHYVAGLDPDQQWAVRCSGDAAATWSEPT